MKSQEKTRRQEEKREAVAGHRRSGDHRLQVEKFLGSVVAWRCTSSIMGESVEVEKNDKNGRLTRPEDGRSEYGSRGVRYKWRGSQG
jgi:hypothetical protein